MRNNKFNSKETYLAYRSEWKSEYNTLSQTIRDNKHTWTHYRLKKQATAMLEELHLSKAEAQRQYLAAKAQKEQLAIA